MNTNPQVKPKPAVSEDKTACMCNKCAGSGVYAMEVRNGRPWSLTGTKCRPCGGRGWVVRYKRGRKPKPTGGLIVREGGKMEYWGDAVK